MSLSEDYLAKRAEAVAIIEKQVPEHLREELILCLRPAIALIPTRCDDSQIPIGTSKFGGSPDVPYEFEIPKWRNKPLDFVAQINLEEVAPFDVESLLPPKGLLSFFCDRDYLRGSAIGFDFNLDFARESWAFYHFNAETVKQGLLFDQDKFEVRSYRRHDVNPYENAGWKIEFLPRMNLIRPRFLELLNTAQE